MLWYNDIEDGFNRSAFLAPGIIDEYRCNQTELSEILDQIAHQLSMRAWKAIHDHDVPADIAGPGTIVRRQTTYWELRAAEGSQYRVHFRDKVEVRLASTDYPHVQVASHHPLLVQYDALLRSLYFVGGPEHSQLALYCVADA